MSTSFTFEEALQPAQTPKETSFSYEEALQSAQPTSFTFEDALDAQEKQDAAQQSAWRSAGDVPLKLVGGVTQGVRMIADFFGADNPVSKQLRGAEDWIAQFYSAQAKQDSKEIARLMEEAKDKGIWENVKAAGQAFATAPVDLVVQGLGTSAPSILAALGASVFGLPAAALTTLGLGAVSGAGATKGAIYDAVKEELKKTNMPADEIEKRATLAQEYRGENLDTILAGGAIGALAGRTGLEGSALRAASARILGKKAEAEAAEAAAGTAARESAQQASKTAAERGMVGQGTVVAGKESGTEFLQGSQEQVAQNVALQREGFDVPTFQGAVGAGTLEALVGGALGAGFGAREAAVAQQEQERLAKLDQINTTLNVAPPPPDAAPDEKIAALTEQYRNLMPADIAESLARRVVEDEQRRAEEAAEVGVTVPTDIKVDPERVAQIEDDLIAAGVTPEAARAEAIAQAKDEAYYDYLYDQEEQRRAGETVVPPSGESVSVAGEPGAGAPAGGTGVVEPAGVVPPTTDAGLPAGGEATEPSAVTDRRPNPLAPDDPNSWQDVDGRIHHEVDAPLPNGKSRVTEVIEQEQVPSIALRFEDSKGNKDRILSVGFNQRGVPYWSLGDAPEEVIKANIGDSLYNSIGTEPITNTNEYQSLVGRVKAALEGLKTTPEGAPSGTEAPQAIEAKEKRPAVPAEGTTAVEPKKLEEPAKPLGPIQLAKKLAGDAFAEQEDYPGEDRYAKLNRAIEDKRASLLDLPPSQRKAAEAFFNKEVQKLRKERADKGERDPVDFATGSAAVAVDQRNDTGYTSTQDVIDSYRENMRDTLEEMGVKDAGTFDRAERAFEEALDADLANLLKKDPYTTTPKPGTLYRATTAKQRYPGKFWTSIKELAERYTKKATGAEKRTVETAKSLPKNTLNVTALAAASDRDREAMLIGLTRWMDRNAPGEDVRDTRLYDVLADKESDFAYPTDVDNAYLRSLGFDSVYFDKEGGETVSTWYVFDKPAGVERGGRPKLTPEQQQAQQEEQNRRRREKRAAAEKKRGRPAKPEEEKKVTAEAKRETDKNRVRDSRKLEKVKQDIAGYAGLDNRTSREVVITDALTTLYALQKTAASTPLRKAAKELFNSFLASITGVEKVHADRIVAKLTSTPLQSLAAIKDGAGPVDIAFETFTTGEAAARYIFTKAGTRLEQLMAWRILNSLKGSGTKIVVIQRGDKLPKELRDLVDYWDQSRGMYVPSSNVVYLRGSSFGSRQAVNSITVLHELLHAATANQLRKGRQDLKDGKNTAEAAAAKDLRALMKAAEREYRRRLSVGAVSPELRNFIDRRTRINKDTKREEFIPFESTDEFLAYGLTDPYFQAFLMNMPGNKPNQPAFSWFLDIIRHFLKLPPKSADALTELIDITDRLAVTPSKEAISKAVELVPEKKRTAPIEPLATALPSSGTTQKKAKAKSKSTNETLAKVERSSVDQPRFWNGVEKLVKERDPSLLVDVLSAKAGAFTGGSLRQLLPTLQTETLVEWANRLGLTNIKRSFDIIKDMNALRTKMTASAAPISERLLKLQRTNPDMYEALGKVMHYSTLRGKDPSVEADYKSSPALAQLWDALNPEAARLYKEVRDYYKASHDLYYLTLIERVEQSGAPGFADDAATPKGKLVASIRKMYEKSNKVRPYFPLVRYGEFWVRLGKGKTGKFYMFESQAEKELFIKQWFRKQKEANPDVTLADLYDGGDIEDGNKIRDARKDVAQTSMLLKEMFELIDTAKQTSGAVVDDFGTEVGERVSFDVDKLKDDVYQLVLQTLPTESFRRRFIHRQGKEGFSKDISRNFATVSSATANQIARIKFSPEAIRAVEAARDALKGNPDQAKLNEFVSEMRARVEAEAFPDPENSLGNQMANFANKAAFLYMMTNVKTAIAQFSALPVFSAPVLVSKHGVFKTAKAFGRFLPVWNSFGVRSTARDGSTSFVAPTIAESSQVKLNPEERRAAQYMVDRGLTETTLAYDLGNRKRMPTEVQNSAPRRVINTVTNIMTGLFHSVERINRELTFMAAFRLAREANPQMPFEQVAKIAEQDTYNALGNFATINRPRGVGATAEGEVLLNAHKPLGRAVLQFKMFPAFVTTYFVRNFYRMLGPEYTKQERKEAATQFFGTLFMSLGLAGVMGVPGFSLAMGLLSAFRKMRMDEDDEDPLEMRDLELWFRNVWLPQTFGDVKVGDKSLAELLDRGVIAALTGYDISSSLSLNNMWFPELKEQATAQAEMQDYFISLLGPFASLTVNQIPAAIDKLSQGKIVQGMEGLLPAMMRAPLTSYRLSQDGATTVTGATIKPAEEFTTGQLIAQAMGFSTEGLVAQREVIFRANALKLKVQFERRKLLDRLGTDFRGADDLAPTLDKIMAFNRKNWFDPITGKTISDSLKSRMKRALETERGLQIEPKYYPQLRSLFGSSIEKLEREAQRSQ